MLSENENSFRTKLERIKVQRADLACHVTSIRLQWFEPWSIRDYSNFAGGQRWSCDTFFIKLWLYQFGDLMKICSNELSANDVQPLMSYQYSNPHKTAGKWGEEMSELHRMTFSESSDILRRPDKFERISNFFWRYYSWITASKYFFPHPFIYIRHFITKKVGNLRNWDHLGFNF